METQYIDTPSALRELCVHLSGCDEVALDTEFVRERTYYARFCLLQLATEQRLVCIDPLALDDLDPLLDVLYDRRLKKIMHAGRQDLELFFDLRGEVPQPVYDTQIAAALLGLGDQLGYASLVAIHNGVVLDKSHSRTDWSVRPLSPEQISYALDDVRYLLPIFHEQQQQLARLGREDWLDQDFAQLVDPTGYRRDPGQTWRRLRAARDLRPQQLAVLNALAEWRERKAMANDKPRKWVLSDDVMVELARRVPSDEMALQRIRGVPESLRANGGKDLLAVIAETLASDPGAWPRLPRHQSLTMEQQALADALQAELHLCQAREGIDAAVLCSRREIAALVQGERALNVLRGWRRRLIGEHLLAFLQGDEALRVVEGVLNQQVVTQHEQS